MKSFKSQIKIVKRKVNDWVISRYFQIAVFNILVLVLFMLQSAGYFHPFLPISVNLIVLVSLISSIFLLGARSGAFFTIAFIFWIFAAFLKVVKIDPWAERTAVYTYEAMLIGVVLLLIENFVSQEKEK